MPEPASDAVPVVIGAAIGAGGAVIAQVASAVFTARRESTRLKWEQQRQAREWKLREAERFIDTKRELYSNFLGQADRFLQYTLTLLMRRPEENPFLGPDPQLPDIDSFYRVQSNIDLIAPAEVSTAVSDALVALVSSAWSVKSTHLSEDRIYRNADKAKKALAKARDAMRADLQGHEAQLESQATEVAEANQQPQRAWWRSFVPPWKRGQ